VNKDYEYWILPPGFSVSVEGTDFFLLALA